MSDIQVALRQTLVADSQLTGMLASAGSVYYDHLPQGKSLPAVIIRLIEGEKNRNLNGDAPQQRWEFEIECVGERRIDANAVSARVDTVLESLEGPIGNPPVNMDITLPDAPEDVIQNPTAGGNEYDYSRIRDVIVWHFGE